MKNSITTAILLAIPLLMSLSYEDMRSITFSGKDLDLFNVRQVELPGGDTGYTLGDIAYSRTTVPLISDLLVTFDTPSHQMVRDDLQHYRVNDAAFQFSKQKKALGKGCAKFYKKDHRIELQTDKNLWLSNCNDLGSFSIEFRVLINNRNDNGILFSRVGYTSGRKNGIEIVCEGNTIVARFSGVFKNMDNRPVDVTLQRTPKLDEDRWYHFAVSFDRLSGKLSSYIDGKQHESVFVSEREEPFINVYRPAFVCEDLPPVIIGENF
ncbi:MAG: LamG-like jellyroll fold domain-containing protein, partial [Spirochaetota bacterium]